MSLPKVTLAGVTVATELSLLLKATTTSADGWVSNASM